MKHFPRLTAVLILFALFALLAPACKNVEPKLDPGVTPPPAADTDAPSETPQPSEAPTEAPGGDATSQPAQSSVDALGNPILTADHFERYISFTNISVFEEGGETLVDCTVLNEYPELLLCAVTITFYNEGGDIIATGSLQMPDGSFLLALENGETPLYARILTDTVLTDKTFRLSFDPETGVNPG